jgi:hypothetical protein
VTTQASFAAALRGAQGACPPGLRCWNGSDPALRFAVHRNNMRVSLRAALADGFPVLQQFVGEEFFAALAGAYLDAEPPRSTVLALYGAGLPDFIAGFAPAQVLPCLPDLARLEWARLQALHAADSPGLSTAHLCTRLAAPEALAQARLGLHPSLAVLASPWAVVSLWAAHQGAGQLEGLELDHPEAALVLRDGDEVLVLPVDAAGAAFVSTLQHGLSLADAVAAASTDGPGAFDLAASLGLLIRHNAICAWHSPSETTP